MTSERSFSFSQRIRIRHCKLEWSDERRLGDLDSVFTDTHDSAELISGLAH